MPASKAQQRAVAKYVKANYDQIQLRTPKGGRDNIKSAADQAGESVNEYILQAIAERIKRDNSGE